MYKKDILHPEFRNDIPKGWENLGEGLLETLSRIKHRYNPEYQFQVMELTHVDERSLYCRIVTGFDMPSTVNYEIAGVLSLVRNLSKITCETCGCTGSLVSKSLFQRKVLCDNHKKIFLND